MTRRVFVGLTILLTALVMCVQVVWAVTAPGFRGPDETHHVSTTFRVAAGDAWAPPGEGRLTQQVVDAAKEAGLVQEWGMATRSDERTKLASGNPDHALFRDTPLTAHDDRMALGLDLDDANLRDQMTQHPPVFYYASAGLVHVLGLDQLPWDRTLLVLRLWSIFLTLPLVPALVFIGRRCGLRRPFALLCGLLPLAIPQVIASMSVMSNDAPAVGLGAVAMAGVAYAATTSISRRTVVLVGVSVGLALWTKGQLLALGLPLVLVLLLKREPLTRRIKAILGAGVLSQIVCPWWLLNLLRFGEVQPDGYQRPPQEVGARTIADLPHFISEFFPAMAKSFVGHFGWLESELSPWVWVPAIVLFIALVGAGAVALRTRPVLPIVLLAPVLGTIALLFVQSWNVYLISGDIGGLQGRYLFPFLAFAVLAVVGLRELPAPVQALFVVGAVAMNVIGLLTYLGDAFPGNPLDVQRMALSAGVGTGVIWGVLVGYGLVLLGALGVGLRGVDRNARLPQGAHAREYETAR